MKRQNKLTRKKKKQIQKQRERLVEQLPILGFLVFLYLLMIRTYKK